MHHHARRCIPLAAAVAVLAAAPAPAPAATRTVEVEDFAFSPKSLAVAPGTRVVWTFTGRTAHNVTVESGPKRFRSANKRSGTFARRLRRTGTYRIVCTLHSGMKQTIRVS